MYQNTCMIQFDMFMTVLSMESPMTCLWNLYNNYMISLSTCDDIEMMSLWYWQWCPYDIDNVFKFYSEVTENFNYIAY